MVPRMDSMDDEILALCKFYRQQAVGVQQDCGQGQAQGWPPPDGGRCLPRRLLLRGGGLRRAFGRECSRSCLFSFVCVSLCVCVCVCVQRGARTESARNTFQNQIRRRTAHLFSKLACCCGLPSQVARSASGRPKEKVGRKKGWRKTTADEDKRAA
jgi:hypothetical protein